MNKSKNIGMVIAIIQAHMSSTRLPGKVMMDISGKPMLWHVANRLKDCNLIDKIVIAATENAADDVINKFCADNGIACFRGSEEDVLERYYMAAKLFTADFIVRITSDCPLIDPRITDKVINGFLSVSNDHDAASNTVERTYPRGLDTEVFSFMALEECHKQATLARHREHVTLYMYEKPDKFRMYSVKNNYDISNLRWSVDEEADLKLIREIYKRFSGGSTFYMEEILDILEKEPALYSLNNCVKQKDV